ncbi:hypothetical protein PR002_g27506 [Phytophthora rubi]|uniref:Uncharacterized protein n=1 Tax=Phytophthora rubi TaxID=129364 RepID=A0A6A3HKR5_9STRA|nr:hypothetical protein PR002_g27506 [Phytophthora rubi]
MNAMHAAASGYMLPDIRSLASAVQASLSASATLPDTAAA